MVLEAHLFRDIKSDFTKDEATNYVKSFDRNECGCLWLHHPTGTQLAILINGNQTYSLFIPDGDHPGWQVAASDDGDWDTEVHFLADNKEPTPMQLALVIPVDRCVDILTHFWETGGRSNTEVWSSLVDREP